jgi:N-acetylneuraminic acid mutarotase
MITYSHCKLLIVIFIFLIFFGCKESSSSSSSGLVSDPATPEITPPEVTPGLGSWSIKSAMPNNRGSGASAIFEGLIFTIGGHEGSPGTGRIVEAYEPSTDTWYSKAIYSRTDGRYNMGSAVYNGEIFIFGGTNIWGNYNTNTVDKYTIANNTWTSGVSTYPLAETSGPMCATVNSLIYCFGGTTYAGITNKLTNIFNPSTGVFTTGTPMATERFQGSAVAIGELIYVIGGYDYNTGTARNEVEVYNVSTNSWNIAQPLPSPLYGFSVGVIDGKIHIAGGSTGTGSSKRTFVYANNKWYEVGSMAEDRPSAFGGVVKGKLYVMGRPIAGTYEFTPN